MRYFWSWVILSSVVMAMFCLYYLTISVALETDKNTAEANKAAQELSKAHALIEEVFRVSIEDDFTSYTIPVTVSAYTARVEECDATPEVTADMTPSRIGLLAVSRDLIQDMGLKFGDVVMLVDHGFSLGVFTIRDVMNSRYRNRVDILHSLPEAARLFGVKEGVLLVRIVGDS